MRDCVHGLISFGPSHDAFILRLLDTPQVQRLRRIRALGPASLAFPGAEHSRFAHAVGSAHVMWRYLQRMQVLCREECPGAHIEPQMEKVALAAALLHDLGHGPYSHSFEVVVENAWAHERWTAEILRDPSCEVHQVLAAEGEGVVEKVVGLIEGRCEIRHLARAVSGTFDVDRCDYLVRDSHMTGVRYGLLDLDWLFASLRLHVPEEGEAPRLAVDGEKGLTAVEGFFLSRLYMYRQVYLHKAVRSAEKVLHALFRRLADAGVPAGVHPGLARALGGEQLSVQEYLELDDEVVGHCLRSCVAGTDPIARELASAWRARGLFKSVALRADCEAKVAQTQLEALLEAEGYDPRYFCSVDRVCLDCYTEDEALTVRLPGGRTVPVLQASPVLHALSRERYVSTRAHFPAALRDKAQRLLVDFQ